MQEKNLIQQIWEIRGKVDDAVMHQKYVLLDDYRAKICSIYDNKQHLYTGASYTLGKYTDPTIESDYHRNMNFLNICNNIIRIEKAYTQKTNDSVVADKQNSILEYVWVFRAIYDRLKYRLENNKLKVPYDLVLITETIAKIQMCMNENSCLTDDEYRSLSSIKHKFEELQKQVFNENETDSLWDKLTENI